MTVPGFIQVVREERQAFGVLNENLAYSRDIFRRVTDEDKQFSPKKPLLQTSSSWRPPIYRNTSLLSSPSRDYCSEFNDENNGENMVPDLPSDFMPPRHTFPSSSPSRSPLKEKKFNGKSCSVDPSIKIDVRLRPDDIVCGRGAPTNFHPGNQSYKEVIKEYETSYLCSKRSDKPGIAMEILESLRARGSRFVKREKQQEGGSFWVEIGDQRAYEKVCQSLRGSAPELRRHMLASTTRKTIQHQDQVMYQREQENYSPLPFF